MRQEKTAEDNAVGVKSPFIEARAELTALRRASARADPELVAPGYETVEPAIAFEGFAI